MNDMLLLTITLLAGGAVAINDGFGRTPPMGFNTYNDIACLPNETYVKSTIDSFSEAGFVGLGYTIFTIDCGWAGFERQSNGSITYDPVPFPNGIAPLSQYAISLGYRWSMYTGASPYQCDNNYTQMRPASQGYEYQDALQFAGWNTVYVKADNCFANQNFTGRYGDLGNALRSVGINGLGVCQWGEPNQGPNGPEGPAAWAPSVGTSYRIAADIAQGWNNIYRITNEAIYINRQGGSGPGGFGDMDLLEVGNAGMSTTEQATHFAIWCMFKSSLFVSTNIPNMASETKSILQNRGLIAINQDSLGRPVTLLQRYATYDIYTGPLANGDVALLIVEQSGNTNQVSINFSQLNVSSATVTNLWNGSTASSQSGYSTSVAGHGSVALRLSQINSISPQVHYNYIDGSSGTLANGASLQPCTTCLTGQVAGYLGSDNGASNGGGSVTFSGIYTSKSTQTVKIDYINAEVVLTGSTGPNVRGAQLTVNNGNPVQIMFPISGYDWETSVLTGFLVELSGFSTSGPNTITICGIPGGVSDTSNYAPNIVGIATQQ